MVSVTEEKEKHNIIDVITFCQERHFNGVVVGRWIWVRFSEKPSTETRQALKDFGFFWNRRRSAWCHNCGHPSKPSNGDPRDKYGVRSISIDDKDNQQVAI